MNVDIHHPLVQPEPNTGCWFWLGSISEGYGFIGNFYKKAHRLAYEAAKGKIPGGLEIDHVCRVKCCVNPDHLEAVTHRENIRRATRQIKTHCPHGHEYTQGNSIIIRSGARQCATCRREREVRRNEERRLERKTKRLKSSGS